MGKKIEYTNGELTIIWQPELCQHAEIKQCPSGALTYRMNKEVK